MIDRNSCSGSGLPEFQCFLFRFRFWWKYHRNRSVISNKILVEISNSYPQDVYISTALGFKNILSSYSKTFYWSKLLIYFLDDLISLSRKNFRTRKLWYVDFRYISNSGSSSGKNFYLKFRFQFWRQLNFQSGFRFQFRWNLRFRSIPNKGNRIPQNLQ